MASISGGGVWERAPLDGPGGGPGGGGGGGWEGNAV